MPKKFTKPSARRTKNLANKSAIFQIVNADGIHTRPAAAFVKLAQRFPSKIEICKGPRSVDGKSILGLLSLGAEKGAFITIKTSGLKAGEALLALGRLIKNGFVE